ncbi:hypothetical protein EJB05_35833, partial [Eragrostis curvula]
MERRRRRVKQWQEERREQQTLLLLRRTGAPPPPPPARHLPRRSRPQFHLREERIFPCGRSVVAPSSSAHGRARRHPKLLRRVVKFPRSERKKATEWGARWDSGLEIDEFGCCTLTDLSFSGLDGDISSSFANLKAVQFLNLSHNNLIASIPDTLSQLPSLTVLDLTGNQLNESIPSGFLKRSQNGSLDLRYGNSNICNNGNSCSSARLRTKLSVYIAVPVVEVSVTLLTFFLLRRRQNQVPSFASEGLEGKNVVKPHIRSTRNGYMHSSLRLENRRFTYQELEMITNNFQRVLGRGGFGYVYDGFLEDGTQVAVKLRSQSSNQGVKEFLAEAQILTRIHHKNLVSMVGYCKDEEYMALVYEYMSEGTLQEHIAGMSSYFTLQASSTRTHGRDDNQRYLTWRQRLRIALESAQVKFQVVRQAVKQRR